MPELVKITPDVFPELYEAFLHGDDPLSTRKDWQNIFCYQWEREEDHTGYALFDKGKAVGMIAMAFSRREIDGRQHKFCNLHTWWVHEDYRGHSLSMLRPLFGLKDYTITHFTPCDTIRGLTRRMGFLALSPQLKILLPLPFAKKAAGHCDARIFFDSEIDTSLLPEREAKIFFDHQPYRVGNMMISKGGRNCYILYTLVERYKFRYCHIHYIGDKELFIEKQSYIRSEISTRNNTYYTAIDARLSVGMPLPYSFDFWSPGCAMYRPFDGIKPHQIDNLYSDIVMLRLTPLPHLKHEIRENIDRVLTRGKKMCGV